MPVIVILFVLFHIAFFEPRSGKGFRRAVAEHRWLVFLCVALSMAPTLVAAILKVGGALNHLSLVSWFVLLAVGAGLGTHLPAARLRGDSEEERIGSMTNAARILTALVVLVGMYRMPFTLAGIDSSPSLWTNSSQVAYNYEKAHPGVAYFPLQSAGSSSCEPQALPQ